MYEDVVYKETIDKIPCRSRLYRPSCLNDNQLSSPSKEDVSTSTYNPSKSNQNNNTQNDSTQNDRNQNDGMRNNSFEVHESDAVYWTSESSVIESDGVRVESESVVDLTDSSIPLTATPTPTPTPITTTTLTPTITALNPTTVLSVKVSGTSNPSNTHSINNIDTPIHQQEIVHYTIPSIHDARDSSRRDAERHHKGCDKIIIFDENSCQNILEESSVQNVPKESSVKNVPQAATVSRGRKQHNQKQNSFMNLSGPLHPYSITTHTVPGDAAVCVTVYRGGRKQNIVAVVGDTHKCLSTSNTIPTLTFLAATVTTTATTTTISATTLSSLNHMHNNDTLSTQTNKTNSSESTTVTQVEVLNTSIRPKEFYPGTFFERIEHSPEKKRTKISPQKKINKITSDLIIKNVIETVEDMKIVKTIENNEMETEMEMAIINEIGAHKGKDKVETLKISKKEESVKTRITVFNATELEKIKCQTWEIHLLYIMKRGGGDVRRSWGSGSRGDDGDGDGDGSDKKVKVGMKNKACHSNDHNNNDNNKHSDSSNDNNNDNDNDSDGDADSNEAHTHLTNCASSTSISTLRLLRSRNNTTTLLNKGSGSDKINNKVKKNPTKIDYNSTKFNEKNSNYDPSQKTQNFNFNYYSMKVADRRNHSEILPSSFFNRQKYSISKFNDDDNGVEYDIDRVIGKGAFGYALLATACSSAVKCGGVRGEVGGREVREGEGKGSKGVEVGKVTKKEEKGKEKEMEGGKGKGKGRGERSGKKGGSETGLPLHPPPPTAPERTQGTYRCVSTCNCPLCNYCIM